MKLSTRTRYGTRAMVELAAAYERGPVSVKEVAEKQKLSEKYLEQIMAALKTSGLVNSVRGLHGGYTLARAPSSIRLGDIFRVLEGSPAPVDCVDDPGLCSMRDVCPTRSTWVEMKQALEVVLDGTTLQDLLDQMQKRAATRELMYNI